MLQNGIGDLAAGEHSSQFRSALLFTGQISDFRHRPAAALKFFHVKMMVRETGDLGKMGDAKHLGIAGKALQPLSNALGHASANAGIDFIKDKSPCPAFAGWRASRSALAMG